MRNTVMHTDKDTAMNAEAVPLHINVRLTDADRQAVATLARALATPHRIPPTISEAIRAALRIAVGITNQSNQEIRA